VKSSAQWLRGIATLVLTVALLAFVLARVDLTAVWRILSAADPTKLTIITVLSLVAYAWLPTWRWQRTLQAMSHALPFGTLMFARFGSQPLKTVIPFKGGEAFRALWLRRRYAIPVLDGAASILFDMFLVAVAQLMFLALGLFLAGSELRHGFVPALLLLALGVGLSSPSFQRAIVQLATRMHQKLGEIAEKLAHGFLRFPNRVRAHLIGISLLVELSEILSMWFCCWAIGLDVPMSAVLLNMPIVMGFTLLPITLSGFGTREIAIVYLFSVYGSAEQLTAAALLFTAIEFILPTLAGLLVLPSFISRLSTGTVVEGT
jgi:hypothetical protein